MKVVTAEEMREIDRKTIEDYGIPGAVLMERAGLAVASKIKELFEPKKVIVLSGGGNNGGDGIVAARNLYNWGWSVKVLLLLKQDKLSPDCLAQYRTAKQIGVPIEFRTGINEKDLHGAIVIDALLGTGLSKGVTGTIAEVISFLNKSDVPVISVDIPSGISSDAGYVMGEAVMADYTVTFGLPKRGHLLYPGAEYTGRLFIEDIGFPEDLLKSDKLKVEFLENRDVPQLIPARPKYSHKGDYGHILVVAGSRGKTGAALMAARACLRSGAGLVTIGVPESLMDVFQSRVTEEMTLSLADDGSGMLSIIALDEILNFVAKKVDVIAIGPGIGVTSNTEKIMAELIQKSPVPVVIDADGINSLNGSRGKGQGARDILKKAKSPIILTPHPGEMSRLLKQKSGTNPPSPPFTKGGQGGITYGIHDIEKNRIDTAISFSKETGIYLVLKGAPTIVAEPEGRAFINPTGNPGMATAGTGDVLTGMISAFLGQGLNPLNASILGVYIHGLAGDIAASDKGEHSLVATDIIDAIPAAFHSITS